MNFSFLPGEVKFFDYLSRATANLLDAARALEKLLADNCADLNARVAQITELEHAGDLIVHQVTDLLPRTLITPIDSDDIQRLIAAVDDALDSIEACAARLQIYQIENARDNSRALARLITAGARELDAAMRGLSDKEKYSAVREHIVQINTLENNGDRVLRDGLIELVAQKENLFDLIRWKEIYELLEQTTDRIEDAADVMQKVMIENA
ncbi:MAG: DUF47 domain-containing protein [Chloroflexi bacterium]|nr:DUF47 domain-containing protein [Chloroflexota bacterium]